MQGTGCRLQRFGGNAKLGFNFPNPCGHYGGFSPFMGQTGDSSQTLPVGETFPTTKWQQKACCGDNKIHAIVTWLALGRELHLGSGGSPPASHPSCHHQPVVWGALVLGTAEQDRKCSCLPMIPHVLFLTLTEQIPKSPPFAG